MRSDALQQSASKNESYKLSKKILNIDVEHDSQLSG